MKVELDINCCYDCPHATNNAQMHDDPFTSGPSHVYWMCMKNDLMIIHNAYDEIDSRCPLKKE